MKFETPDQASKEWVRARLAFGAQLLSDLWYTGAGNHERDRNLPCDDRKRTVRLAFNLLRGRFLYFRIP
ncbi:MAG: hypothetical protein J7M27_06655 [Candidatus Latescibacteria bacterium]|nr:hypothetical protein [Candidatus Latescibacterota bacterium]